MSVSAEAGTAGRIVTFYSYKGGTGRTMALANVAWLLATNGYRVLAVDWDLESPGLHRYFHPFLRDKNLRSSEGILDLIRKHASSTLRGGAASSEPVQVQEYAASLDWDFPHGGLVDFVPAGRQDLGYAEAVSTFDWDMFWNARGRQLLDALREDMLRNYDFVLIDSRTGTSDTGGICTVHLPDTVVNCFTLNTQSISGAVAITGSIRKQNPGITVLPLPTRIEDGEQEKLKRGRGYSRSRFEPYLDFLGDQSTDDYWNGVEVPYIPYYAYEETLAVFGDVPHQNGPLLGPYVRLASRLAGRECPAELIAEPERTRVLREFEQTSPREKRAITVAYAPLDRIWAEWLRERLTDSSHVVRLVSVRDAVPELEAGDHLVVVFSRDLVARDGGLRLLRITRERVLTGAANLSTVLRVDATSSANRIPSYALIDAMGSGEERVLEAVSSALGLEPRTERQPSAAVRYPADLPPHFRVTLTRNPRFSGRGGVIENLRRELLNFGAGGGALALTGLPGVGKTQTALEYVYRFAASYDGIWWISAAEPGRVRRAYADIATDLGLPGGSVDEQIPAVLEAFRRAAPVRRWLVVLDNVDEPTELHDLLPSGPGHVLITSRNPQWSATLKTVDVGVFRRNESLQLLEHRVQHVVGPDADRLADRLGDLPLALEQAGGWLSATGMAVADYLALLDESTAEAMSSSAPPAYDQTVASTVGVAYDRMQRTSPAATRLIELLAFMAPEVIPYRIISNRQLTSLLAPINALMHDQTRHGALIQDLGRYGLARVDAGTTSEGTPDPRKRGVVVHRLTQDIVRSRLSTAEQAERRQEIQSVLAESDRGNPDEERNWATYESLRPHLEPTGTLTSDRPESRELVIDMVRYLWVRGDYTGCIELAKAALRVWKPRFGEDDVWALRLRRTLALALRDRGEEPEAYLTNEDSLERLRRVLGPDDPYALATATSFGADLRARGEYDKAARLDEETVRGYQAVYGDNNAETLNAVNNWAISLRFTGNFQDAARRDRDALERRRSLLGPRSVSTLSSQENLGTDYTELGDLDRAVNLLEGGYDLAREVLGPDHLRVFRMANSYSIALRRSGQVAKAAEVIDDAVRRAERILGRRHRVTLNCRLEQADVRWAENKIKEAGTIGEEVYADFQEVRGEHHPDAIASGNDLAIFRRAAGDVDGALTLAERTFDLLEGLFQPSHSYTLAGMITKANAQWSTGSHHLAADTDAEVLRRVRRARLSDRHPAVLAAMVNWSLSHEPTEPDASARTLADAHRTLTETYGPDHPHSRAARDRRRIDQDIAPFTI